jgi:hypothetical protein
MAHVECKMGRFAWLSDEGRRGRVAVLSAVMCTRGRDRSVAMPAGRGTGSAVRDGGSRGLAYCGREREDALKAGLGCAQACLPGWVEADAGPGVRSDVNLDAPDLVGQHAGGAAPAGIQPHRRNPEGTR